MLMINSGVQSLPNTIIYIFTLIMMLTLLLYNQYFIRLQYYLITVTIQTKIAIILMDKVMDTLV